MVHLQASAFSDVIRRLSAARDPACLLDAGGNYLFVNEAWDRDGASRVGDGDGGENLVGTSWLDRFACEEVRRLHAEFLFHALKPAPGARPRPEVHILERNTSTSAVLVAMKMEPVLLDGGPVAVAITHTPVRQRPIDEVYPLVERGLEEYRSPDGTTTQCACCRRMRDPAEEGRWDLVASVVESPPAGATQGLCGLCRELHYGQPSEE